MSTGLSHLYKKNGSCYIEHKDVPFSNKELNELEEMCEKVPKEFVEIGDAGEPNYLTVGRFQTDVKKPKVVNKKFSKTVMNILDQQNIISYIKKILNTKKELYIRRVQFNEINKNCFIGYHLDIDSNPDYLAACVIQFGSKYDGGLYRVYRPESNKKFLDYKSDRFSLIVSNCLYPHEVTKVVNGSRKTLVFFVSDHFKENRRLKKN